MYGMENRLCSLSLPKSLGLSIWFTINVLIFGELDTFNGWHLYALEVSPTADPNPLVIATFDTKAEAELALLSLFDSIKNDTIWSAKGFKEDLKQNVSAVNHIEVRGSGVRA